MKFGGFAVLLACAACGDVKDPNKLPDAPMQQDGPMDDAADIDAPPPRCDPNKPFGTPVAVGELNLANVNDFTPALSSDELTITFGSTRMGGSGLVDAYIATRASRTDAWGTPSLINGVNTSGNESRAHLSGDQLTLYIEYQLDPGTDYNVVASTRSSTSAAFTTPIAVTPVNTTGHDTGPYVLPDQSAMYLVNSRMLHRAARTGTAWGAPVLVTGTSLQGGDFDYPVATPDELTIYFASSRGPTQGGFDIWMATRASVVTGFNAPVNVAALSSNRSESPGWISADNCVMYFSRDVGAAAADYNIYRAEKPL